MNDQNKEKEPQSKERIGYGVRIPTISFEDAIRITKEIVGYEGFEGSLDTISTVTGNTASSSKFLYKVYALKGFGLLTYQENKYSLTELGRKIAQPESPELEKQAILEAFLNNPMIKKVWDNYVGKILPQREYLANFFENNLGIPAKIKLTWADYFIAGGKFAKILHERESGSYQILSKPTPSPDKEQFQKVFDKVADDRGVVSPKQNSGVEQLFDGLSGGLFYQKKISDNRKAMIYIPEDLTDSDITMIRSIIKSVDAGLEGLKKHEANEQ
jgi:hypothetical protein